MSEGSPDTLQHKVITAYLIFQQNLNRPVTVRLLDENGTEYGRATTVVACRKGQAQYVDFIFDPRTSISSRGTASFE
jgi:hypothetical protein